WKINPTSPGLIIDPGGNKWPDLLGHGGGSPSFFISDRVLESLRSIGAPIGRVTEMPIAEINAKLLKTKPAPKYFVVETQPGIEVDFAASNIPTHSEGKPILTPLPKPWPPLIKVRADSWNG